MSVVTGRQYLVKDHGSLWSKSPVPGVAVLDGQPYELEAGDFLFMPRKQRHELIIDSPVRMLSTQGPGGIMDKLMEAIGEYVDSGQELTNEAYTEIQARFGVHAPNGWL